MTVTFPRSFPLAAFSRVSFDLDRYVSSNALYGGQTQVREMASPRWVMAATTGILNTARARTWKAWLDSLKGGVNSFYAYDPELPYPGAYPAGFAGLVEGVSGDAFTGTAIDIAALTSTTIQMTDLPAAFVFTPGDLIGLVESGKRGLHRVLEEVTASGLGSATVSVEPPVLTNVFSDAAHANLVRPVCIMTLEPGSVSAQRSPRPQPISFRGIQKVI